MGKLTHTVSADVAQFRSADKANVESLKLSITPVQNGSGDPAPDNIRPIAGWTYVDAFASNKNLWNDEWYKQGDWSLQTSGTYEGYYWGNSKKFLVGCFGMGVNGIFHRLMNLGRVRISFDLLRPGSTGSMRIYFIYEGDTSWTNHSGNITSSGHKSYVSTSGKNCVGVAFYTSVGVNAESFGLKNLQIEISDTETAYEISRMSEYCISLPIGKNIFNEQNELWINGYYISSSLVLASSDSYKTTSNYIPILPSTTYTLQVNRTLDTTFGSAVITYDKDKNLLTRTVVIFTADTAGVTGVISGTFTTDANAKFIRFYIPNTGITNIQIEEGSTATAYEPCMPIYGGYVDLVTGEVWRTMELLTVTSASASEASYGITYLGGIDYITNATNAYCNCLKHSPGAMNENSGTYVFNVYKSSARNRSGVRYRFDGNSPAAGSERVPYYNAQLKALSDAGTPMQVCYELANPVLVTTLTPTQVKTLLDRNSIWNSTGSTEVTYEFTDRLAKRRMLMQMPQGGLLPGEYQQVEYLSNITANGRENRFIATGIKVSGNQKKVYVTFAMNWNPGSADAMMVSSYQDADHLRSISPYACACGATSNTTITPTISKSDIGVKTDFIVTINPTGYYIKMGGWSDGSWTQGYWYRFRVEEMDGTVLADYIPCYRKSDNKPGMYDLTTATFRPSDGSEDFGVGPEV